VFHSYLWRRLKEMPTRGGYTMPTIRIDDEVFAVLQKRARAFIDSPNDVLRRDYGLNGVSPQATVSQPTGHKASLASTKVMGRVLRGQKTPEGEYIVPILEALVQAGGRGRAADIVDQVGRLMSGRLNEYDHKELAAGEIRWRNTAEWCRNTMANKSDPPLLNPNSSHGWWEITEEGRKYLEAKTKV
jgi:hypothetical protein